MRVAKIRGPRGLRGELNVAFFSPPDSWLKKAIPLYLGVDENSAQEYKLKSISANNHSTVLEFHGCADRTAAEKLAGLSIFADESLFESKKGETVFLSELLGFTVFDGGILVGAVEDITSNGPQDILVLFLDGREVQIPFVEAFLREIDFKNKKIHMQLPEGLWQETD